MSARQELATILRTVDKGTPVDPSCQVLVSIDMRTGLPVRPGFFSGFGRKHQKHLLVTNTHRSGAIAVRRGLDIEVDDFSRDWHFGMVLDYEAKCAPGREIRVAQALWSGPCPQEKLEKLVTSWILQRLEGRLAEFLRDFDQEAAALGEDLRAHFLEQTGLTLAARLFLTDVERAEPLPIGPLTLAVRVLDRDDEISLRLQAELAVEPGQERLALLQRSRNAALETEVQKGIREFFASEVTLQRFHADLSKGIHRDLWARLNKLLAPYGRRMSLLLLDGEAFPGVVESKRIEHQFSYRLRDYPDPVEVRTELLLQLNDLGRYVRAKAPDLKVWADQEVESAVIESLFGVSYTDLCLHYDEKKMEIEQQMKHKAAAVGYELKQLITITNLQLDLLRRPFSVRMEGEFSTNLAKLKVKLEVNMSLVVPNPSDIASLLDRRVDVREQIRATLADRIQQRLHQTSPESFYMQFEAAGDQPSVREQLDRVIIETVRSEFHAEVLSLSCKQLDTALSLRLESLMTPLHLFSIEVVASRGGPAVVFDGSFRVNGVDEKGWLSFQTSNPEPERLCECARRHLQHMLADEALDALLLTSNLEQKKKVGEWIQERIKEEFGLQVRMMDWLRRPLAEEQQAAKAKLSLVTDTIEEQTRRVEVAKEMRNRNVNVQILAADSRLEQIRKLQERLARVLVTGGSPEEEEQLRMRIERLQQEQDSAWKEATADRSNTIIPNLRSSQRVLETGLEREYDVGEGSYQEAQQEAQGAAE